MTDADTRAEAVATYAGALEKSMSSFHETAETLVKTDKGSILSCGVFSGRLVDMAKNYFQLGLAFTELGNFESEQGLPRSLAVCPHTPQTRPSSAACSRAWAALLTPSRC
jgi:hypothetical protein